MWPRLLLLFALSAVCALADPPKLQFQFTFEQPSGSAYASDTNGGGLALTLPLVDYRGAPLPPHGETGWGPAGEPRKDRALDLPCPLGPGTNGPVAANTNLSLGLGEVKAFTTTLWFKSRSKPQGSIGPRLLLLGSAGSADDTGATNSIGLKFQNAGLLHAQLNRLTAEANFVWSLPTNTWLFLAMVYDGARLSIYEGSERVPASLVTSKVSPGQKIEFGSNCALFVGNRRDRARAFDGWIDDLRFYTGAADPDFVENVRRSALGRPSNLATDDTPPSSWSERPGTTRGDWIAFTSPGFGATLAPLAEQRRAEGLNVSLIEVTNGTTGEQIRERLKSAFPSADRPRYVLLAGVGTSPGSPIGEAPRVPTLSGSVARMKDQPSDFGYSLPEATGRPTVAVGRFPARTRAELAEMVAKTLRLERSTSSELWRSSMFLVQGNPGGGGLADFFVDSLARPRIERLHPVWQFSAMADNSSSLFYLPVGSLRSRCLEAFAAGQLFTVYLGHSFADGMTTFTNNFLSSADWAKADFGPGQGVFFSCGCFGCDWDRGPRQSYGLAAMRNPKGPAAVIGAYGESFSAPGLLAVDGLLRACSQAPFPPRLADYWLAVQSGLAEGELDSGTFSLLDMSDGTQGKVSLAVQRSEHLEMWTLLGDPALRLPLVPLTITLHPCYPITPGPHLTVEGTLPRELAGATVRVLLERAVGVKPANLQPLPRPPAATADQRNLVAVENNQKVNARLITYASVKADGQHFRCVLEVPSDQSAPVVVLRAQAEAGIRVAQGVLKLPAVPAAGEK